MYRIRLHGRGGQGMKTASRILGSAFFSEGFEVQDAPRYGAERRGAPVFATVRAGNDPIHERGIIERPDLVVVADDTLVAIPVAGVSAGACSDTLLLLATNEDPAVWSLRLQWPGDLLALPLQPRDGDTLPFVGTACAAAAARVVGVIGWSSLEAALRRELADVGADGVEGNLDQARAAWEHFAPHAGIVAEGPAAETALDSEPDWVDLPCEGVDRAAPGVRGAATSVQVRTGLWRTMRPVIDLDRCRRCSWICGTLCPDGAIPVDASHTPSIDLDHCKGCMICVAVCPSHAIESVPERIASAADGDPT